MPPFKQLPRSEKAAESQGLSLMTAFFTVNKRPGRPSRNSTTAGRPAGAGKRPAQAMTAPTAKAIEAPAEKHKKAKLTRTNWSKGENLEKMTDAIADWDAELKKKRRRTDEPPHVRRIAQHPVLDYSNARHHR